MGRNQNSGNDVAPSSKLLYDNSEPDSLVGLHHSEDSLSELAANAEGGAADGFEDEFPEVDDDSEQNQGFDRSNNQLANGAGAIFGAAADAIGGGDMLGDMGGNDEMTRLEMEMMGEDVDPTGLGQPTGITLRVFINMDEDDDGDKGIDLNSLFKLAPGDLPFHVDVSMYSLD